MESTLFTSFGLLLALILHKPKRKLLIVRQIDVIIYAQPTMVILANDNVETVMPTPEKKKKPKKNRKYQKIQTQQIMIYPKNVLTQQMIEEQNKRNQEIKEIKCKYIGKEVQQITNFFIDDLKVIIPYNGHQGIYAIDIDIPGLVYSSIPIRIKITSEYPSVLPQIQIQTNNLHPLQKQKLHQILKEHKNLFISTRAMHMGLTPSEQQQFRQKILQKQQQMHKYNKQLQKSVSMSRLTSNSNIDKISQHKTMEIHEIQEGYLQIYYPYILNLCISITQQLFYRPESSTLNQQSMSSPQFKVAVQRGQSSSLNNVMNLNKELGNKKQILQNMVEQILNRQDDYERENIMYLQKQIQFNIPKFPNPRGRYLADYQQIQMIGEGGFGRVYRCRHRIDSNIYAVKKMVINYNDRESFKLLKQVSFLSKLNHPNIVRYHQSWLQDTSSVQQLITDMKITDPDQIRQFNKIWNKYSIEHPSRSDKIIKQMNSEQNSSQIQQTSQVNDEESVIFGDDVIFGDYSSFNDYKQVTVRNMDDIQFQHSSYSKTSIIQDKMSRKHSQIYQFPFKILYIVMQYCGSMTLKDFIIKKFSQPTQVKIKLIRGMLQGLSYIHSRRIMHRDLKPANIFLIENMNKVKIGDFGLATIGNIQNNPYQAQIIQYSDKTKGVGTTFYRAPQQVYSTNYDEKIDIYALGIILLQLFYHFDTNMQRYQVLTQVTKYHRLPKDFNKIEHNSQFQQQIQSCISSIPSDRPTVQKLLQTFRNKYFTQLVSLIANPKHFQFYQLMNHIFGIKNQSGVIMKQNLYKNYLTEQFIKIYQIHRGVLFTPLSLVPVVDFDMLNGIKMQANRKQKFLLLSQRGVVMQYPSNTFISWIRYAKQTLKRNIKSDHHGNFRHDYIQINNQMRRFTFQKVSQFIGGDLKSQFSFKQKYVTAFDITFQSQNGLTPYFLCQMLKISLLMIQTMCLTQKLPSLYLCHSLVFKCLALQCNASIINVHRFLLSTTDDKFRAMKNNVKVQFMNNFGLQGNIVKRIIAALQADFQNQQQFINFIKIKAKQNQLHNIQSSKQLDIIIDQIQQQIMNVSQSLKIFQLYSRVRWKIHIPQPNTLGIFWNVGPVKGFTTVQEYLPGQQLCNLHLQTSLNPSQEQCEAQVSVWSNGQFLQKDIMEVVAKCWENNLTVKWYDQNLGEKDLTCRYNIILKKKNQRVYLMLRKNHFSFDRSLQKKLSEEQKDKQQKQSAFILKQHFNYEVLKNFSKQNHKKQSGVIH